MKPDDLYDPSMTRFEWFAVRNRRTLLRVKKFARGPLLCLLVVGPLLWFGLFHTNASPIVPARPPKRSAAKPGSGAPPAGGAVHPTTTGVTVPTTVAAVPAGPVLAVSGKAPRTRVYRSRTSRRTDTRHR